MFTEVSAPRAARRWPQGPRGGLVAAGMAAASGAPKGRAEGLLAVTSCKTLRVALPLPGQVVLGRQAAGAALLLAIPWLHRCVGLEGTFRKHCCSRPDVVLSTVRLLSVVPLFFASVGGSAALQSFRSHGSF